MEDQFGTDAVVFVPNEPDIKFKLEENDDGEYKITVNVDIYAYMVYEGRKYTYLMLDKKLYRCSKKYSNTVIKMLEVFRKNFTKEILLPESQLSNFFSIVQPSIKNSVNIGENEYKKVEKYIPAELYAKLYLDYNDLNYVLADIRFIYGDVEINPLDS